MNCPMTQADYWLKTNGKWRTARKDHPCNCIGRNRQCAGTGTIQKGETYLDTGERLGPFTTYKLCKTCAALDAQ